MYDPLSTQAFRELVASTADMSATNLQALANEVARAVRDGDNGYLCRCKAVLMEELESPGYERVSLALRAFASTMDGGRNWVHDRHEPRLCAARPMARRILAALAEEPTNVTELAGRFGEPLQEIRGESGMLVAYGLVGANTQEPKDTRTLTLTAFGSCLALEHALPY